MGFWIFLAGNFSSMVGPSDGAYESCFGQDEVCFNCIQCNAKRLECECAHIRFCYPAL